MYGDAFDIDPVAASLEALADACGEEGAGWVGVYETHVHCDWRDDPMSTAFYPAARSVAFTQQPEVAATLERAEGGWWSAPAEGWDEGEPLREWSAYGADDALIEQVVARHYLPPREAAWVQVVVGRALTLERAVP